MGSSARHYNAGPWVAGTPQQGYQLRLVPRDIYRLGIAEANDYSKTTFQMTFDQLTTAQQDQVLTDMQGGKIKFQACPQRSFSIPLLRRLQGRLLCRSGLWREPRQGRLETGWVSRRANSL